MLYYNLLALVTISSLSISAAEESPSLIKFRDNSSIILSAEQKKQFNLDNLSLCPKVTYQITPQSIINSLSNLKEQGPSALQRTPFKKLGLMLHYIDKGVACADLAQPIIERMSEKFFIGHSMKNIDVPENFMYEFQDLIVSRLRFVAPFVEMPVSTKVATMPYGGLDSQLTIFSPDSLRVAIHSKDLIELFDLSTDLLHWQRIFKLPYQSESKNYKMIFAPDKSILALYDGRYLHIVDITDGKIKCIEVRTNCNYAPFPSVEFTTDNKIAIRNKFVNYHIDIASGLVEKRKPQDFEPSEYIRRSKKGDELVLHFHRYDRDLKKAGSCWVTNEKTDGEPQKTPFFRSYLTDYINGKLVALFPDQSTIQVSDIEFTDEQEKFLKKIPLETLSMLCAVGKKKINQSELAQCIETISQARDSDQSKPAKELLPWMLAHLHKAVK